MIDKGHTLTAGAVDVLRTANPECKAARSRTLAGAWRAGHIGEIGAAQPPERPARPPRPKLVPPRAVPRRRIGRETAGRSALLHALAHIELNAIDLAWDLIARFAPAVSSRAFCDEWVRVAEEEARHFELLNDITIDAISAGTNITTIDDAEEASSLLDEAFQNVALARINFGASQNRLEIAFDAVNIMNENNEAARSEMMDLDVVAGVLAFASQQLLLQTNVGMLGQAQQQAQLLAQLLR